MTFLEIVIPPLKQDSESIAAYKKVFTDQAALLSTLPHVTLGYGGWIMSENDREINEQRFFIAQEWTSQQDCFNFGQGPEFGAFIAPLIPLVTGPAFPEMFKVESSTGASMAATVTEIFRIRLSDTNEALSDIHEAWEAFIKAIKAKNSSVQFSSGQSLIAPEVTFLGEIGWQSLDERKLIMNDDAVLALKGVVQKTGTLTSCLVRLESYKTGQ